VSSSCTLTVNVTGTTSGVKTTPPERNFHEWRYRKHGVSKHHSSHAADHYQVLRCSQHSAERLNQLSFTITNPAINTISLTGIAFTDTLPLAWWLPRPTDLLVRAVAEQLRLRQVRAALLCPAQHWQRAPHALSV